MAPDWLVRIDWKKHTPGLIALCCVMTAFLWSLYNYRHASQGLHAAKINLTQQQQQNIYSENQMTVFSEYFPRYEALQNNGVVGNKKRLQWLETVRDLGKRYDIPGVSFTLENARPGAEVIDYYWHPELGLAVSPMLLSIKLVHEGDWYRLLQGLRAHAKGVFSVEECQLRKELSGANAYLGGLNGTCLLEWYTVTDLTESWGTVDGGLTQ